jgi:hypothetical protein
MREQTLVRNEEDATPADLAEADGEEARVERKESFRADNVSCARDHSQLRGVGILLPSGVHEPGFDHVEC